MGEAIVITSGKGGVGKTTTSANVGSALALNGAKVCMVDTDLGLRNLDVLMGLESQIYYDLVDVIEGRCTIEQALVKDIRFDNLYMLPATQTKDKDAVNPDQVKQLVDDLKRNYDYVIIDCPAGIEQGFKNAIAGADRAIVVTNPELAAVRDADRVIGLLASARIHDARLVVNRVRPNLVQTGAMLDIDEICQILSIDLIGVVPDDELVIKAANSGQPTVLNKQSRAALAYHNIARRIAGESVPLMKLEEPKSGVFGKMKKMFGLG